MADKNSSTAPVPRETPIIGASQPSDGAKPKRRRTAKIKAIPPAQTMEYVLTTDEIRLLMAYRRSNDRTRDLALRVLPAWADASPRRTTPAPTGIRLVTASGKRVAT